MGRYIANNGKKSGDSLTKIELELEILTCSKNQGNPSFPLPFYRSFSHNPDMFANLPQGAARGANLHTVIACFPGQPSRLYLPVPDCSGREEFLDARFSFWRTGVYSLRGCRTQQQSVMSSPGVQSYGLARKMTQKEAISLPSSASSHRDKLSKAIGSREQVAVSSLSNNKCC
ncbi:hypothetical protein RRG08_066827 [Elysia crispata]|uniref:Uncharacterized protein n=1 Tax=Elysia crispata TaxID=231223 RepID=A0AAE0XQW3_9GAST|nr:hypothetical protein RRG08_066827 [Elysia crispata]